jgi:hypothetical protein
LVDWRAGRGEDPYRIFEEALKFLAAFQAWRAITTDLPRICGDAERDVLSHQVTAACERLGIEARPALIDVFTLVAADCPAVAKKDPHPGNWLRAPDGRLVLIDIEANTSRPLLQEAVILIDDLPLLPLTDDGWDRRMSLVRTYLRSLDEFGFPGLPTDLPLAEAYEAFAVLNAARGLGRLRHADPGVSSFSLHPRSADSAGSGEDSR